MITQQDLYALRDSDAAEQVAECLLKTSAVQINLATPFTWSSGLRSPIYCDNRKLLAYPSERSMVRNLAYELCVELLHNDVEFDCVYGVATAGIPPGDNLADKLGFPFGYVRDKPKSHGQKNQIEGDLTQGTRALVVEDLISTGGSSLRAVDALQEAGVVVVAVFSYFSYELYKARKAFTDRMILYAPLCTYDELVPVYKRSSKLMKTENRLQLALLSAWNTDPQAWSEEYLKNRTENKIESNENNFN